MMKLIQWITLLGFCIIANLITFIVIDENLALSADGWTNHNYVSGTNRVTIMLDKEDKPATFTLMHEQGHVQYFHFNSTQKVEWELLSKTIPAIRDYSANNTNEDFADSYAYYFLRMPLDARKQAFIVRNVR